MDCEKIGRLIAKLRKEKGLTQKNIAEQLRVSSKTVSKWECGMGCPDLTYWPDLSTILGVDMMQMMEGEIIPNQPDSGNIERIRFYVCPMCGNILFSTGSVGIYCCGRKLEKLEEKDIEEKPLLTAEYSDGDYYITMAHPMEKGHYIAFAAYAKNDKVTLHRLYPEQSGAFRMQLSKGGKLYLYCTKHGLAVYKKLI